MTHIKASDTVSIIKRVIFPNSLAKIENKIWTINSNNHHPYTFLNPLLKSYRILKIYENNLDILLILASLHNVNVNIISHFKDGYLFRKFIGIL